MKARVLVEGQFFGQVIEVLAVSHRRNQPKKAYRLATIWGDIPYPAWFDVDEIQLIKPQESKSL